MEIAIAYVTNASQQEAETLAETLLGEGLIACANTYPITSVFTWEGSMQKEEEVVAMLKTSAGRETALRERITALHPYETPCVLTYRVEANKEFAKWVELETKV